MLKQVASVYCKDESKLYYFFFVLVQGTRIISAPAYCATHGKYQLGLDLP